MRSAWQETDDKARQIMTKSGLTLERARTQVWNSDGELCLRCSAEPEPKFDTVAWSDAVAELRKSQDAIDRQVDALARQVEERDDRINITDAEIVAGQRAEAMQKNSGRSMAACLSEVWSSDGNLARQYESERQARIERAK
jgi:hypothetical protein